MIMLTITGIPDMKSALLQCMKWHDKLDGRTVLGEPRLLGTETSTLELDLDNSSARKHEHSEQVCSAFQEL